MRKAIQRCATSLPRTLASASSRPLLCNQCVVRKNVQLARSVQNAFRSIHQSSLRRQQVAAQPASDEIIKEESGPVTRFEELHTRDLVHPHVVEALTRGMKLETMTEVQSKTINQALQGDDIIAQARTGTGKTLAFLIPILQRIISVDPELARRANNMRRKRTTADDIRALIISPTRELAEQIAMEANRLVQNTGIIVQTAVGGTMKRQGLDRIQRDGCHILVGTPGRLKDILSDPYTRVEAPDLAAFVLDEADRLLDQGFWPEIQEIMRYLPTPAEKDRQTMMFSATVPKEVVSLVRSTLKPGFQFVRCVSEDEDPTHPHVPQRVVTVKGFENALPALVEICNKAVEESRKPDGKPFKALVYFNSTAEVALAAQGLQNLTLSGDAMDAFGGSKHPWAPARILEIHAKLSQAARTQAADNFRRADTAVMLSSDVTARGMDFPNVTHVIQVGLPTSRDQYIHRIGRTARAGREGEGWLILNQIEAEEARSRLRKLPLKKDSSLQTAGLDLTKEAQVPVEAGRVLNMFQNAMRRTSSADKAAVYRAQLGVFQWLPRKDVLIENMNNLAKFGWGMREPPMIAPGLAQRLGISRLPGVRIGNEPEPMDSRSSMGRGRGGGFGGRDDRGGRGFGGGDRGDRYGGSRGGYDRGGSFGGSRDGSRSRSAPRDDPFGM